MISAHQPQRVEMPDHGSYHARHPRNSFQENDAGEPLVLVHLGTVPGHQIEARPHCLDTPVRCCVRKLHNTVLTQSWARFSI